MADIDIDVNPQQSPINISPNPQQNIIPVEVGEGTSPTYWGQILGDIDNQTDLKERLDSKQDTIVDLDKYLKNNTTQDNGLAIKGTVSGPAGTAVGDNATGRRASVAVGHNSLALNYGVAIGGTDSDNIKTSANASSVALGYGAVCNGSNAAQIGMGQNDTGGTLQFQDYRLLDASGHIPNDRMPTKADTDLGNMSTGSVFNVLKPINETMILSTSGEICTLGTRKYYKSNTGNCFAGLYTTSIGKCAPILVGETAASVTGYDDYNSTARYTGTFTWNGRTFYYMAFTDTQMPLSSSNLKTINLTHIGNTFADTDEGYILAAQTLLEIYYNSAKYYIPTFAYNDGKNYCRVYADGWCEQGGFATGTPNVNITFLKPFLNTDYILNSTIRNGQGDGTARVLAPLIGTNTTTGITLQSSPSYSGTQAYWEAKGYVF